MPASPTPPASEPGRSRHAPPEVQLEAAAAGDRVALARLLSAVEAGGERGRAVASLAYHRAVEASTVGITGSPGAGKSTLTSRLIAAARADGHDSLAVLAVDPSSPFTGGAILGDRIRMQDHALDAGVYIRSMATRGHVGGLTLAVPEAIRVLAACGVPLVLVETVGVGQVEVDVASATDTTVVVVNPRWGDAVQANKAGLLEIADLFVINKADLPGARETRRDLEQMLDLSRLGDWRPPVVDTVAATGDGVDELWTQIGRHRHYLADSGLLERRRRDRLRRELELVLSTRIRAEVDRLCRQQGYGEVVDALARGALDPYEAADRLVAAAGAPGATGAPRTGGGSPSGGGRRP